MNVAGACMGFQWFPTDMGSGQSRKSICYPSGAHASSTGFTLTGFKLKQKLRELGAFRSSSFLRELMPA